MDEVRIFKHKDELSEVIEITDRMFDGLDPLPSGWFPAVKARLVNNTTAPPLYMVKYHLPDFIDCVRYISREERVFFVRKRPNGIVHVMGLAELTKQFEEVTDGTE